MPVKRSPLWEMPKNEFEALVESCTSVKDLLRSLNAEGEIGPKTVKKRMDLERLQFTKKATRAKRSPVWIISSKEFHALMDRSNSIKDAIKELGLSGAGSYEGIRKRMAEEGLDYQKFVEKSRKICGNNTTINILDVLVENSSCNRGTIKQRVLEQGLLEEKCDMCGLGKEWQERPLVLILDHVNGINNDHRLENLRMLCPNCNSQTSTFAGRNTNKGSGKGTGEGNGGRNCKDCQKPIHKVSTRCQACRGALRKKNYNCRYCKKELAKKGTQCRDCFLKVIQGELKPLLETVEAA